LGFLAIEEGRVKVGADVFITKPVDGEHLVQALEQLRGAAVA
jgi:CheY-like chemotaxis protein